MMDSSREDSHVKEGKPASTSSLLGDFIISSSSSDSTEEQPRLAAAKVKENLNTTGPSTTKINTPKSTTNRLSYPVASRERQLKEEGPKAVAQLRKSGEHNLPDFGLYYSSSSSDTDQEVRTKPMLKLDNVSLIYE